MLLKQCLHRLEQTLSGIQTKLCTLCSNRIFCVSQYGREMKKNCNMLYYNLHQTNHNQIRPRIWMYGNIGISFDWPAFCNSFIERFMFQSIFYGNI